MTKIIIDIESCKDCPKCEKTRVWTADSWENVHKWDCLEKGKQISGYVDWYDKVPIPDWCPKKLSKKMYRAKLYFAKNLTNVYGNNS